MLVHGQTRLCKTLSQKSCLLLIWLTSSCAHVCRERGVCMCRLEVDICVFSTALYPTQVHYFSSAFGTIFCFKFMSLSVKNSFDGLSCDSVSFCLAYAKVCGSSLVPPKNKIFWQCLPKHCLRNKVLRFYPCSWWDSLEKKQPVAFWTWKLDTIYSKQKVN